jgi:hypothetical protein
MTKYLEASRKNDANQKYDNKHLTKHYLKHDYLYKHGRYMANNYHFVYKSKK